MIPNYLTIFFAQPEGHWRDDRSSQPDVSKLQPPIALSVRQPLDKIRERLVVLWVTRVDARHSHIFRYRINKRSNRRPCTALIAMFQTGPSRERLDGRSRITSTIGMIALNALIPTITTILVRLLRCC